MKLHVIMEHEITILTETLCSWECDYAEGDYPLECCNLFKAARKLSADKKAYKRLPGCIARTTAR